MFRKWLFKKSAPGVALPSRVDGTEVVLASDCLLDQYHAQATQVALCTAVEQRAAETAECAAGMWGALSFADFAGLSNASDALAEWNALFRAEVQYDAKCFAAFQKPRDQVYVGRNRRVAECDECDYADTTIKAMDKTLEAEFKARAQVRRECSDKVSVCLAQYAAAYKAHNTQLIELIAAHNKYDACRDKMDGTETTAEMVQDGASIVEAPKRARAQV